MSVRSPLYWDGSKYVEMSTAEVNEWLQRIIYEYSQAPTSVLTIVGSGGSLSIDDTRLQAGVANTGAPSAFPTEAQTLEPTTVTVSHAKSTLSYTANGSVGHVADSGNTFPVFWDPAANTIQAMSQQDVLDTFCYPAVDLMVAASESANTGGTYTISTSSSVANYTEVSGTANAIFSDTRADTALYSAAGMPESLDQPTTITNYYLHRRDGVSNTPSREPMFIDANSNVFQANVAATGTRIGDWLRWTAAHDTGGYKIAYTLGASGSGQVRGSSIADTKLNGAGDYQTLQAGADDYRAQEFPNGISTTISTYNLYINKV